MGENYIPCNSNNTTEDNNTTEENMCKFLYSTEEFALLRVIAAILFLKDIRWAGQAQMSWISGDAIIFQLVVTDKVVFGAFFQLRFAVRQISNTNNDDDNFHVWGANIMQILSFL